MQTGVHDLFGSIEEYGTNTQFYGDIPWAKAKVYTNGQCDAQTPSLD